MRKFTDKQKLFIRHYMATLNATEAANLAGYKGNRNTLNAVGNENLAKPSIRNEIDRLLAEIIPTPNETLIRIGEMARGTIADFLDDNNKLSIKEAKEAYKLGLVKKFKETETSITNKFGRTTTTTRRELELYPADSALDKLMRHHGLYDDKLKVTWRDKAPVEQQPLLDDFFKTAVSSAAKVIDEDTTD